jgi:hypothetical protein
MGAERVIKLPGRGAHGRGMRHPAQTRDGSTIEDTQLYTHTHKTRIDDGLQRRTRWSQADACAGRRNTQHGRRRTCSPRASCVFLVESVVRDPECRPTPLIRAPFALHCSICACVRARVSVSLSLYANASVSVPVPARRATSLCDSPSLALVLFCRRACPPFPASRAPAWGRLHPRLRPPLTEPGSLSPGGVGTGWARVAVAAY